ncbi:TonB-dependent receptor [Sphingobacterium psychroaquaticum]|uniref:outer membrane beta-barrel family protein n=1 Tax=Sphingobacterium psychroaquaticum TaxID=561061 RepID=UPI00106AB986|nr:outer membrane beta-barrel family protein [Sphingobacterium psychroaquaticum]QBQ40366.1 TonB-dependent receptor [Sphingobacterium psychroaquaticum]
MLFPKKLKLLFFFLSAPFFLLAQQGKLQALIVDAETNEPIIGASAALLNQQSKAYVQGAQTNVDGVLLFNAVDFGTYAIRITYVGKQDVLQDNIKIQATSGTNLGTIRLRDDGNTLQEIKVEGRAAEMKLGIDRKVFDVSQSLVSVGGTASDLLANVPTLQVDMDGSVSLRGSNAVKILIDGKESAMAGSDINSLLQSLPANAIDKVEIITNPSSKYDAEGQSGIINIVLKKNIRTGLNGSVNASGGSYNNYMAGVTLNYRDRKFNYFGSYNFNRRNSPGSGLRNNRYLHNNSEINNTEESSRKGINNTFKLGADYFIDDKTTIGVSGNLSIRDNDRSSSLFYTYRNHPTLNGTSTRTSTQDESDLGYDLNLDFSRKFRREGSELTANFSYGRDTEDGVNDFIQTYSSGMPNDGRINNTSEDGKVINIQLDYILPLGEDSKFEAGYRTIIRKSFDTQFSDTLNVQDNNYYPDYSISNDFDMTNTVHAWYANYQNKLTKHLGYQIGMRAEQAILNTSYFTKDPSIPVGQEETKGGLDYFRWYPSAFLTYEVGASGDKVQLSYTRRVQRPRGWQVNPFPDVSDEMNRREGNPNLMPEDIHSLELSFAKFYSKWNFISTLYYRRMNDVMQPYIYNVDDNSVTYSKWENLTSSNVAGLELISKVNVTKWWDVTWNGNFFYNKFEGNSDYDIQEQKGFNWNTNINTNLKFTSTWSMQVRGDYYAPNIRPQGKTTYMTGIDVAVKKEFMNKRASLALNVRDLLDTRRFGATTITPQINSSFEHRWMKRMFNLSFSYRFGTQDNSSKKRPQNDSGMDENGGNF